MTLLELRAQLEALLTSVLGTYTLPNGSTTPAIAARSAGEDLPTGTSVTGLEVVVLRDPVPLPLLQYTDAGTLYTWTVYLVDWSGDSDVADVGAHLVNAFPGTDLTPEPVAKGGGPYARLRATIRSNATDLAPYVPVLRTLPLPRGISITNPTNGSQLTAFRTDVPLALSEVNAVIRGTGSVTFTLKYAADRSSAGTAITTSTTISNTTTGVLAPVVVSPIPAEAYVWLEVTGTTGSPTELSVTLAT